MHLPFTKINGFIFLERTGPGVEDIPPSFPHLRILEGLEPKPSYVIHQGCGISPAFPFQGGRKSSTENFVPQSLSLSLPSWPSRHTSLQLLPLHTQKPNHASFPWIPTNPRIAVFGRGWEGCRDGLTY